MTKRERERRVYVLYPTLVKQEEETLGIGEGD